MATVPETRPWPTELRLAKDRRSLAISFEDGASFTLSAEYLRVESPSAEVQGHNPDERITVGGKREVGIMEVNPVGNYAVRLVFEQGRSVADVARSLDVHVNTLHGWVRGAKQNGVASSPRRSSEHEEISRLRRELRRVTEERDILKKAAAYFASSRRGGTHS